MCTVLFILPNKVILRTNKKNPLSTIYYNIILQRTVPPQKSNDDIV